MILLFDENTPPAVARSLQQLAEAIPFRVLHVTDVLRRGTLDVDIFAFIQQQDEPGEWFFATHDANINRNKHERAALQRAGVGVFVFTGRTARTPPQFLQFVLSKLEEMARLARKTKCPFVYSIPDRGKPTRL